MIAVFHVLLRSGNCKTDVNPKRAVQVPISPPQKAVKKFCA